MWLYLTFLLIIGSAIADHHHGWETGNEYHFLVQSRTLTVLNGLTNQFSGILMKGNLIVQVKSSDTLRAMVKMQYAPVQKVLPEGWESEITDLEFRELSFRKPSEMPFEIKLKQGVIQDVLFDLNVPTWEINLLKSIVSQLQIDTEGENVITTRNVPNDNPFGTFKTMEDSVGGKCEVLYNIAPLPEDVLVQKPELVPFPNLRKDGHYIKIMKTKNYTRCEQRMAYHSGIIDGRKINWKPGSNNGLLSRSSTSHIVISGNVKRFTIQSSVTTNKILINSKIHKTYNSAVYSRVNITLDKMSKISNLMPASDNLKSTGNLVYIYNNPFSEYRKSRLPSINRSSLATQSSESNSNSSSEESRDNDSNSSSSEEHDYLQPKPKLDEAPESPLLPYFIGFGGKNIQQFENFTVEAINLTNWITRKIEYYTVNMLEEPFTDILEEFTILVRLIRTLNVKQITEIENKLSEELHYDPKKYSSKENQKLYNQTAWDVFSNAVAHAGTGPALITIKNWIKNKKIECMEAANIISQIPKAALTPTAEYVKAFFELITDEQVKNQKFLNTTAPLSFAELIRYTQSDRSSNYYPIYSFNGLISKPDLLETYISYMSTQLREAIKEGDNRRIQTYIMALGNFGHVKVLSVFEPYLEGTLPISKFQRLMMVISLNRLIENFPRVARSVAYKIYMNTMEAYELRCAAVYVIMKTNPPLSMLQQMAEFTNQDQNNNVNSAVKSSIEVLADLKQPELQDLANKARIARKQLNPHTNIKSSSQSIFSEMIASSLNIAQTSTLQTISNDDTVIPKGTYFDIHQSYGGVNLPSSRLAFTISDLRQLIDMWDQAPFFTKIEKKSVIEDITEKLGIKPEDPEQIEGNIFADSMFSSMFFPFDNHTFEEIVNEFTAYVKSFNTSRLFETKNINNLYHYDLTLGFPTESGLPFIYTLTIPKLDRISGEGSHVIKQSSLEKFMDVTVTGNILSSEKIQSRIGFVTPFEHKHYIAGIDINTQIFIPAGLSFLSKEEVKKIQLKILPNDSVTHKYMTIHHSVVPYTASYNILSFESVFNNDVLLANTNEPHEIVFSLGKASFVIRSDLLDEEASKTGYETFIKIFNIFNLNGAHYRKFDAILYLPTAEINITNSYLMYDDVNNTTEAAIPAIIDKQPESETRKEQFLEEVSKDVNSAISYAYDISIFSENNYHVFTFAVADSYMDNKCQALFYWNMQEPNGKVLQEFCTIGYTQSSSRIPLNFKKPIEEIPKYEFKAEMRFGNCDSGEKIRLKGNLTRTDDIKEKVMKSEIVEKCWQEMKQGDIWMPICQKASELIREKDHLMMSIDVDSDSLYMLANQIFANQRNAKPKLGDVSKNTINMEIKRLDDYDIKISLSTSLVEFTFFLTDLFEDRQEILDKLKKAFNKESKEAVCVIDKTQVVTFDGKIYPLKLENCWHVIMTTYAKRDSNNPERTLNIPKYLETMVMAREMDDGSKQIRMILGDQEIHLQKSDNYLEATVNNQPANFSHYGSYRENTFEIYRLDGVIVVFSLEFQIYAVYDGERILLRPSYKYLGTVRGLCGNYDMQSDNDFIAPKNCILTKPEEFTATYALTHENCQGLALQNKRKAEQSTCILRSYRPSNVISDREAGRSSSKNRRWDHY